MCLILIIAGRDQIFLNVSPSSFYALQGPLENDLVVHVALVAESQRYEMHSSVGRGGEWLLSIYHVENGGGNKPGQLQEHHCDLQCHTAYFSCLNVYVDMRN